jgi:putative transposase
MSRALVGEVHRADRRSPYASDDCIEALDAVGAVRSMSRNGDCWDNAVAETAYTARS